MSTMKSLTDAMRKKAAKLRRSKQNAKRKRTWTGARAKGNEVMKRVYENERACREFIGPRVPIDLVIVTFVFQSTTRGMRRGFQFRNPGKVAVRMDRKVRKERQRLRKKMRNADRKS